MIPSLVGVGLAFVFILHWIGYKPGTLAPICPDLFSYDAAFHSRVRIRLLEAEARLAGKVSRPRLTRPGDDRYYGEVVNEEEHSMTIELFRKSARSC